MTTAKTKTEPETQEPDGILGFASKLQKGEFLNMDPEEFMTHSEVLHRFHNAYTKIVRPDWDSMVETYLAVNGADAFGSDIDVDTEVYLRKPRNDKKSPAKKAPDLSGLDI